MNSIATTEKGGRAMDPVLISGLITLTLGAGGVQFWLWSYKYSHFWISANPPYKGLVTRLGKPIRDRDLVGPGLVSVKPLWEGCIPIPVGEYADKGEVNVRTTKGRVNILFPFSLEARVIETSNAAIEFLRSMGPDGSPTEATGQIKEMIIQIIRDWVRSPNVGPLTWEEALDVGIEIYELILEKISSDPLRILPEIPNYILIKYFSRPQKKPTAIETVTYGKNWLKIKTALTPLTAAALAALEQRVQGRIDEIEKLKNGEGEVEIAGVGMALVKLNFEDVRETGNMAALASVKEEEALKQGALDLRGTRVSARAKKIKKDHPDLTDERALEEAKVIDGIVKKTINETQFGLSPATIAAIENSAVKILEKRG